MIWKLIWAWVLGSALFGERHPNMKHPPAIRMEALRIYWDLRDISAYTRANNLLHADRTSITNSTFR